MTDSTPRRSIWFGRFVLAAATLLMIRIGVEYLTDPVGAVAPRGITLASAEAVTMMRVSGGVFLAMAIAFAVSLASARRLLAGLGLLAIFAWTLTVVRLIGLAVDGPAPFTLKVLKPEVALVVLSSAAFVLLRRRGTREPAQLTSTRTPATSPNA